MIGRYTRPEMGAIWELQNKFEIWKEIEVLACEAQAELGKSGITKEEAAWIRKHAGFTVERIDEIEKVTNHDVIAFTTNMAEYIDADVPEGAEPPSRWVHYGMTSSDLGDTALSYQITQALDIILKDVALLGETCKRRAFEFQETLCVGRTHGVRQLGLGPEARPDASAGGSQGCSNGRNQRCCWNLFQHRPIRRAVRLWKAGSYARPALYAGSGTRSPCSGYDGAGCYCFHVGVHRYAGAPASAV